MKTPVILSTGRVVLNQPQANGSNFIFPHEGKHEFTEAEWEEYCELIKARNLEQLRKLSKNAAA